VSLILRATLLNGAGDGVASTFRPATADRVEAIGMRVLLIAEDMRAGSRHHGRSERLIDQAERAAIDLRAAVRGR
jgi:hypothetical protein